MAEVVILPGLDGTARLLERFCGHLRASGVAARAIAYPADRPLGYPELEQLVRDQLPVSSPFVLLGESFSGPLAINIASDPPPGLKGLVLSTTFARAPVPVLTPLAALVRFAPARPPMSLLSWALLGRWATPDLQIALADALRQVSPDVIRARAAAALRVDVSSLVPSIRVPALQLVALQDRLLAPSAARLLAATLPASTTVKVPGPHLLLQASTEQCAREVAHFSRGLRPN